jgi:hypothetical protein
MCFKCTASIVNRLDRLLGPMPQRKIYAARVLESAEESASSAPRRS